VIRIRPVLPHEWPRWRDLRLRALQDTPRAFGETYDAAVQQGEDKWRAATAVRPNRICLFAEFDGAEVGMAVVTLATDEDRRANLYAMWVAPEARRVGAGRALVDAAMRWARFAGARTLVLRVTEINEEAVRLYRATGFVDSGGTEQLRPGSPLSTHVLAATLGPLVMGVVNVTPDSFSDGGAYLDPAAAIDHGLSLIRDGADILDVGGEATNPSAAPITPGEELTRILPVIEDLARHGATVSVDTTKAEVARAAVAAGATIINDISGGLFDPAMRHAVAELDATYIAGHLRGTTIGEVFAHEAAPTWREVTAELGERLAALPAAARARTWIDPGLGFGKGADPEGNLDLIRHVGDLGRVCGAPVVVGPSRKRFLRKLTGREDLASLDAATVAACLAAVRAGAHVVRVHNVALLRAALAVYTRM
jgi:dihydropteroate synthase